MGNSVDLPLGPRIPSPPPLEPSSPRMELPPLSPGIQVRVMDEAEVLETVRRGWSGGTVKGKPPAFSRGYSETPWALGWGQVCMEGTGSDTLWALPFCLHQYTCSTKAAPHHPVPCLGVFLSTTLSHVMGFPALSQALHPPEHACPPASLSALTLYQQVDDDGVEAACVGGRASVVA